MTDFVELQVVSLKDHPNLSEAWVRDRIVEDPSRLGLGHLDVKDVERIQPRAGRLDLLLQDSNSEPRKRYEVEIQLGKTDESHIIRTIEYWDNERKKYKDYDHVAVLVAEDVTSRFFNVIGLLNGAVPIIAIKMNAISTKDGVGLAFTKLLDLSAPVSLSDDDDSREPTDRKYWEQKGTPKTLELADKLLTYVHEYDDEFELNYNKHYIGLRKGSQSINFIAMRPKKKSIELGVKLDKTSELDDEIVQSGLDTLAYSRWGEYRLSLTGQDIQKSESFLRSLIKRSYNNRIGQFA